MKRLCVALAEAEGRMVCNADTCEGCRHNTKKGKSKCKSSKASTDGISSTATESAKAARSLLRKRRELKSSTSEDKLYVVYRSDTPDTTGFVKGYELNKNGEVINVRYTHVHTNAQLMHEPTLRKVRRWMFEHGGSHHVFEW